MEANDQILQEIKLGEDSTRQFKQQLNNAEQLAKEMCAQSNSLGGKIWIGITDEGLIRGISADELRKYNQWIAAAANEHIKPPMYPRTVSHEIDHKLVLEIRVPLGAHQLYCDHKGRYWVKSGSDTRNASPQELARLFQKSTQITLDEMSTQAGIDALEKVTFLSFFEKKIGSSLSATNLSLAQTLNNMNLAQEGQLTLAGLLLFGKQVQHTKPFCSIRAIAYAGTDITDDTFIDRRDCMGTLSEQFRSAMSFLKNNLRHVKTEGSFNQTGQLEVKENALEEVIVNALLHRDYSKNAVIRLLIFKDRIEVVSPGSLPNHLTVENIKTGNSVMRNPILASHGVQILPYSGIGSGILRILRNHPKTDFNNDRAGEQFTVIMDR